MVYLFQPIRIMPAKLLTQNADHYQSELWSKLPSDNVQLLHINITTCNKIAFRTGVLFVSLRHRPVMKMEIRIFSSSLCVVLGFCSPPFFAAYWVRAVANIFGVLLVVYVVFKTGNWARTCLFQKLWEASNMFLQNQRTNALIFDVQHALGSGYSKVKVFCGSKIY